jgi:hypothetical protein
MSFSSIPLLPRRRQVIRSHGTPHGTPGHSGAGGMTKGSVAISFESSDRLRALSSSCMAIGVGGILLVLGGNTSKGKS